MGSLAVARLNEYAQEMGVQIDVRVSDVIPGFLLPLGYMGSPTILVAGLDIDPAVRGLEGTGAG